MNRSIRTLLATSLLAAASQAQLVVSHLSATGGNNVNLIKPYLRVENQSASIVDLSKLSLDYLVNEDNFNAGLLVAECWYSSATACSELTAEITAIPLQQDGTRKANVRVRLGFRSGTLAAGQILTIQWGLHDQAWQHLFNETDDWSFTVGDGQWHLDPRVAVEMGGQVASPAMVWKGQASQLPDPVTFKAGEVVKITATGSSYILENGAWVMLAEVGKSGPIGLPGAVGATGAPGPKGDVGPAGLQGPKGETGLTGPVGPAGKDGAVGLPGPKGDVGAAGVPGPKGEMGYMGMIGLPGKDGAVGMPGPKGDPGVRGDAGAVGPQGPKGDLGPKGEMGYMGMIGPPGKEGAVGMPGPKGDAGVRGDAGAVGPQGPKGDLGPMGIQGPMGMVGPAGAQGPKGDVGPVGSTDPTAANQIAALALLIKLTGAPMLIDTRDGQGYKSVKIGTLTWMAQNLNYAGPVGAEVGSCLDNNPSNCSLYGRNYTWTEVMAGSPASTANPSGVRGICPIGWHVPSYSEFYNLVNFVGRTFAGKVLKSTSGWTDGGNGTDDFGFNGLSTVPPGQMALWWSTTLDTSRDKAINLALAYWGDGISWGAGTLDYSITLRCVKD